MAPRAAAKNSRPRLRDETADQTLRRLLAAQFALIRAREPAARRGSVAALHDVRVALRRMRFGGYRATRSGVPAHSTAV